MGDVYGAVADPTRRQLIRLLAAGALLPLHEMTARFPVGRTAVSKHLAVLESAGLVTVRKAGRRNSLPPERRPVARDSGVGLVLRSILDRANHQSEAPFGR